MTIHRKAIAFTLFSTVAFLPSAHAQDVPPVLTAIFKAWETQYKVKPQYKSITNEDGDVTAEGITASIPVEGAPGSSVNLSMGKLELDDVSDKGDGLFEVGAATFTDTKMEIVSSGINFSATIPEIEAEGWFVKALGDSPTPADKFRSSMSIYRKASSGPMTVNVMGQTLTADGFESTWDGDPVTGSGKTSGKITNVVIPESAITALDQSGTLKQLGYSSLSFDLGGEGTISNDGTNFGMDFDGYYAAKDVATIKVGMAFSNVPIEMIHKMQETEPGKEPDFAAMMPQIQGINFGRFVFRFEDASITKKLLPMAAAMQGMDEQTLVANAGAMVQLGLGELKNPAFTEKVVKAVSDYLKDPKSITISAKPAAPVQVQQLMALDPANPGTAIDQLGITVTAND